jgi:hypothetical protein
MVRPGDEAGIGVLGVIMFGATLSLVTAVVMSRGAAQFGNAAEDRCWEAALGAAESALNWGAAQVDGDPSYATDSYVPSSFFGTSDERIAAVDAADLVPAAALIDVPGGQGVFLREASSDVLYGVGFCGDRADDDRTARVVRTVLGSGTASTSPWTATYAFLSGEDLTITGNVEFGDPEVMGNNSASVHANEYMTVSGNARFWTGCVTSSDGGQINGNVGIFGFCPGPSERFSQPEAEIPAIVPEDFWFLSEYDMCPGGTVHAGPAHPTLSHTVGSNPCSGHQLASGSYRSFDHDGTSSGIATWSRSGSTKYDGSYYFHHGSVSVSGNAGSSTNPWQVLIVASSSGECPNNQGGDISTSGNLRMTVYQPSTADGDNTMMLIAGRDITASGNGKIIYTPAVIAAHEQIRYTGNVEVMGSFLAESACDTSGSPLSTSSVHGNAHIITEGSLDTALVISGEVTASLASWTELR